MAYVYGWHYRSLNGAAGSSAGSNYLNGRNTFSVVVSVTPRETGGMYFMGHANSTQHAFFIVPSSNLARLTIQNNPFDVTLTTPIVVGQQYEIEWRLTAFNVANGLEVYVNGVLQGATQLTQNNFFTQNSFCFSNTEADVSSIKVYDQAGGTLIEDYDATGTGGTGTVWPEVINNVLDITVPDSWFFIAPPQAITEINGGTNIVEAGSTGNTGTYTGTDPDDITINDGNNELSVSNLSVNTGNNTFTFDAPTIGDVANFPKFGTPQIVPKAAGNPGTGLTLTEWKPAAPFSYVALQSPVLTNNQSATPGWSDQVVVGDVITYDSSKLGANAISVNNVLDLSNASPPNFVAQAYVTDSVGMQSFSYISNFNATPAGGETQNGLLAQIVVASGGYSNRSK